jgi:hypothetical protein
MVVGTAPLGPSGYLRAMLSARDVIVQNDAMEKTTCLSIH